MAIIYSASAGRVVAVQGNSLPLRLDFTNWQRFPAFNAITTSIGFAGQGGHQVSHSLQDMIYVYTFNERAGRMHIGGLAFAGSCENENVVGLDAVQDYYDANSITAREQPIRVSIGNTTAFDAFMTGISHNISDASSLVDQFSLNFFYVPRRLTAARSLKA